MSSRGLNQGSFWQDASILKCSLSLFASLRRAKSKIGTLWLCQVEARGPYSVQHEAESRLRFDQKTMCIHTGEATKPPRVTQKSHRMVTNLLTSQSSNPKLIKKQEASRDFNFSRIFLRKNCLQKTAQGLVEKV